MAVSEPEGKLWKLRDIMAADMDGNLIRASTISGRTPKGTTRRVGHLVLSPPNAGIHCWVFC
jgi:hypothetical protein